MSSFSRSKSPISLFSPSTLAAVMISLFFILNNFETCNALQVAVVGTTGNIARATIELLSKSNVRTRCLLRHDISSVDVASSPPTSKSSSVDIAAYLASLPNVEMVKGDVTNKESLIELSQGCDAIMALQGPPRPDPLSSLIPLLSDRSSPTHPYTINYIGIQNIIEAAKQSGENPRIIRLTGKGEDPFSIFSILINMLGCLAKGWNYEGEALLRESGLDYTIIRPGILNGKYQEEKNARMLKDNGEDLKVSQVSYSQIADVCLDCLSYDNTKKSTLTVMNVEENEGRDGYGALLEKVKSDSREFPKSLIAKHRAGARLGGLLLFSFLGLALKGTQVMVTSVIAAFNV